MGTQTDVGLVAEKYNDVFYSQARFDRFFEGVWASGRRVCNGADMGEILREKNEFDEKVMRSNRVILPGLSGGVSKTALDVMEIRGTPIPTPILD